MASLEALIQRVAAQETPEPALRVLVEGLADRIRATSNDQNVQKLAREIRASTQALIEAVRLEATV